MINGSIDPTIEYVEQFSGKAGAGWPVIKSAREDAYEVQRILQTALREFTSDDVDVVVFGSLARREWTSGSDVDWTMLVDGQADTEHRGAAREIGRVLTQTRYRNERLKEPGGEGTFGNMAFSHEIVHHIGGEADTNRNTTQRVLLLLEATALRSPGEELSGPLARVARQILNRYLLSDSNFHAQTDHQSRIPRFLLNDIVRYWRTMCVDFAYKDWEQAGKKWAIRNIKLRMSRKLLFIAGLLMAFSCYRNESLKRDDAEAGGYLLLLQKHLLNFVLATPLNSFVWTMTSLGMDDSCKAFLDCYEQFLAQINNREVRDHLGRLKEKEVYSDKVFLECRDVSHRLQVILKQIFFEIDSPLREFTFEYGVF